MSDFLTEQNMMFVWACILFPNLVTHLVSYAVCVCVCVGFSEWLLSGGVGPVNVCWHIWECYCSEAFLLPVLQQSERGEVTRKHEEASHKDLSREERNKSRHVDCTFKKQPCTTSCDITLNDLHLENVSAFVQAFDANSVRWIKPSLPSEEGCGINSSAWIFANFTLIQAHLASCLYSFEVLTYLKRELGLQDRREGHTDTCRDRWHSHTTVIQLWHFCSVWFVFIFITWSLQLTEG